MCEIFPEVDNCCGICTVRIGMLYICVLSISSGAIMLIGVEKQLGGDFNKLKTLSDIQTSLDMHKAVEGVEDIVRVADTATKKLPGLVSGILAIMSAFFIIGGLLLLFATLTDQEGFIQVFVWLVFANIFFGLLLTLVVSILCMFTDKCIFKGMDWLTSSACLLAFIMFLFMWLYFISVANSHVLSVYK